MCMGIVANYWEAACVFHWQVLCVPHTVDGMTDYLSPVCGFQSNTVMSVYAAFHRPFGR